MADTATKRPRRETLEQFRTGKFLGLGFEPSDAERLAYAKDEKGFPLHESAVIKLLAQGCSKELAIAILT